MNIFKYRVALILALLLNVTSVVYAQHPPKHISFSGVTYSMVWQSHPSPNYSKYQYLPQGQKLPYYQTMLIVERLTGPMATIDDRQCPPATAGENITVDRAACAQIQFLKQRKQMDPITNYEAIKNERLGEVLLDFIASADDSAKGTIIEWNGYRYIPIENGVMLYAQSIRAYGNEDGLSFLQALGEQRGQWIQALISARVPPFTFSQNTRNR